MDLSWRLSSTTSELSDILAEFMKTCILTFLISSDRCALRAFVKGLWYTSKIVRFGDDGNSDNMKCYKERLWYSQCGINSSHTIRTTNPSKVISYNQLICLCDTLIDFPAPMLLKRTRSKDKSDSLQNTFFVLQSSYYIAIDHFFKAFCRVEITQDHEWKCGRNLHGERKKFMFVKFIIKIMEGLSKKSATIKHKT